MIKKHIAILLMSIAMAIPAYGESARILLKNGREIKSDTVWEENGMVKYNSYGAVISIPEDKVEKVIYDSRKTDSEEAKKTAFQFDIWESGMSVYEIIDTAERNDKGISQSEYSCSKKHFDYKVKQYANTATMFCYSDDILGKKAIVKMYMTPSSKKLHTINIYWSDNGNSEFIYEVDSILQGKYGKPIRRKGQSHDYTVEWFVNGRNSIILSKGIVSVSLVYSDTEIEMMGQEEANRTHTKERKEDIIKDKDKF